MFKDGTCRSKPLMQEPHTTQHNTNTTSQDGDPPVRIMVSKSGWLAMAMAEKPNRRSVECNCNCTSVRLVCFNLLSCTRCTVQLQPVESRCPQAQPPFLTIRTSVFFKKPFPTGTGLILGHAPSGGTVRRYCTALSRLV